MLYLAAGVLEELLLVTPDHFLPGRDLLSQAGDRLGLGVQLQEDRVIREVRVIKVAIIVKMMMIDQITDQGDKYN